MPATFIDIMIKRFGGLQFFPVAMERAETGKKPAGGSEPSPRGLAAAPPVARDKPVDTAGLHRSVQDRSYFLWKEAGEPEGRAEEFWRQALDEHLAQRARAIWERAGRPSGKDDDHWYQACRDLERAGLV